MNLTKAQKGSPHADKLGLLNELLETAKRFKNVPSMQLSATLTVDMPLTAVTRNRAIKILRQGYGTFRGGDAAYVADAAAGVKLPRIIPTTFSRNGTKGIYLVHFKGVPEALLSYFESTAALMGAGVSVRHWGGGRGAVHSLVDIQHMFDGAVAQIEPVGYDVEAAIAKLSVETLRVVLSMDDMDVEES